MQRYPNLEMLAVGCMSGEVREWTMLRSEARALLDERHNLAVERDSVIRLFECYRGKSPASQEDMEVVVDEVLGRIDRLEPRAYDVRQTGPIQVTWMTGGRTVEQPTMRSSWVGSVARTTVESPTDSRIVRIEVAGSCIFEGPPPDAPELVEKEPPPVDPPASAPDFPEKAYGPAIRWDCDACGERNFDFPWQDGVVDGDHPMPRPELDIVDCDRCQASVILVPPRPMPKGGQCA